MPRASTQKTRCPYTASKRHSTQEGKASFKVPLLYDLSVPRRLLPDHEDALEDSNEDEGKDPLQGSEQEGHGEVEEVTPFQGIIITRHLFFAYHNLQDDLSQILEVDGAVEEAQLPHKEGDHDAAHQVGTVGVNQSTGGEVQDNVFLSHGRRHVEADNKEVFQGRLWQNPLPVGS